MKFALLMLSAFALIGADMTSAENNALRGRGGLGSSDVVTDAVSADSKKNGGLPKFFPSSLTEDQIINFKETAAQKRQAQRDARRDIDNPNRSQNEEDKERARKTEQSRKRNNIDVDPYASDDEYGRKRETKRAINCERNGEGCDYSGANPRCYNDCVDDGSLTDRVCARKCKYIDTDCNENCRNNGNSVSKCLDRCQENIDRLNDDDFDDDRFDDDFDDDYYYDDDDDDRNPNTNDRTNRGDRCRQQCKKDYPAQAGNRYRQCRDDCPNN